LFLLYFSIVINLEGDTLGRSPQGMVVNRDMGLISWTPTATQIGTQTIDVLVTDTQGAVSTQTYNLVVGNTPINQAPTISSQPKFSADINAKYQYQVVANDPERDSLTYTLTTAPTGMVIDAATGLITWDNPILGQTQIDIAVTRRRRYPKLYPHYQTESRSSHQFYSHDPNHLGQHLPL
jgi:hypothetical protein